MAEIKFEEALKKLEKIVSELEGGDISLEESLKKYGEGVKLAKLCTKKLEEAEQKVEILIKGEEGKKEKKPFKVNKLKEDRREKDTEKEEEDNGLLF